MASALRIVSFLPSATEMVCMLGLEDSLVGVTHECDYPPSVKHKPVVFTCVTDPVAAGAGKSFTGHLPFVVGVGSFPPVARTLEIMQKLVPSIRAVGVIYNPAEANSVKEISVAREVYQKRGIRLEEVGLIYY